MITKEQLRLYEAMLTGEPAVMMEALLGFSDHQLEEFQNNLIDVLVDVRRYRTNKSFFRKPLEPERCPTMIQHADDKNYRCGYLVGHDGPCFAFELNIKEPEQEVAQVLLCLKKSNSQKGDFRCSLPTGHTQSHYFSIGELKQ